MWTTTPPSADRGYHILIDSFQELPHTICDAVKPLLLVAFYDLHEATLVVVPYEATSG